jgi:NADH:ubiquinone oxidoreductase subunit F (NADH-binding)
VTRHPAPVKEVVEPPGGGWRLLSGWAERGRAESYSEHVQRFGRLPLREYSGRDGRQRLVETVAAAGLRGRGGAAFPTARKLAKVAGGHGRAVVVGNGGEGEPASRKDRILAEYAPHLVLDGALLAAHATGADEVHLCMHLGAPVMAAMARAVREHPSKVKVRVAAVPGGFVASEESALVHYLDAGDARPTNKSPGVFERGVKGRPTFVGNFETLAQLALVARFGGDWFRSVGTEGSPGTALITVDGAVRHPGVVEVPYGLSLSELLECAGGPSEALQALLVGGYAGHWLRAEAALPVPLTHEHLAAAGASVGVGSVIALPARACGVTETAHVLRYLANQSASQCGPCMFGLPAIALDFAELANGSAVRDALVLRRLERRLGEVVGRGACAHPDGAVRLAESALRAFEPDVRQHLAGRPCAAAGAPPRLPLLQSGRGLLVAR